MDPISRLRRINLDKQRQIQYIKVDLQVCRLINKIIMGNYYLQNKKNILKKDFQERKFNQQLSENYRDVTIQYSCRAGNQIRLSYVAKKQQMLQGKPQRKSEFIIPITIKQNKIDQQMKKDQQNAHSNNHIKIKVEKNPTEKYKITESIEEQQQNQIVESPKLDDINMKNNLEKKQQESIKSNQNPIIEDKTQLKQNQIKYQISNEDVKNFTIYNKINVQTQLPVKKSEIIQQDEYKKAQQLTIQKKSDAQIISTEATQQIKLNIKKQKQKIEQKLIVEQNKNKIVEKFSYSKFQSQKTREKNKLVENEVPIQTYLDYFCQQKSDQISQKISNQITHIKYLTIFRHKSQKYFKSHVDSVTSIKSKKFIQFKEIDIQLATIQIVQSDNVIQFTEQRVDQLKYKFRLLNAINNCIIKIRTKNENFNLTVAPCCMMQYKGVYGLAIMKIKGVQAQISATKNIQNNIILLKKQLEKCQIQLDMRDLYIIKKYGEEKKIYYILQIKNDIKLEKIKKVKSKSYWIFKNMNSTAYQELLLIQNPNKFIKILILSKIISKIYKSCSLQLDSIQFWNFFFKQQPYIWTLIKNSGYNYNFFKEGLLISLIEKYCMISFQWNDQNQENPVKLITFRIKSTIYDCNNMELVQIMDHFNKYMKQKKYELAQKSIEYRKTISNYQFQQIYQNNYKVELNKIQLLLIKKQFNEAIKECKRIELVLDKHSFKNLEIFSLLLRTYSMLNYEKETQQIFHKILNFLNYEFGEQSQVYIEIYSIMAHHYAKNKLTFQKSLNLYNLIINLLQNNSQKIKILIDLSQMYLKYDKFQQVQSTIKKIFEIKGYEEYLGQLYLVKAHLGYKKKQFDQLNLELALNIFITKTKQYQCVDCFNLMYKYYETDQKKRESVLERIYQIGKQLQSKLIFNLYWTKLNTFEINNNQIITLKQNLEEYDMLTTKEFENIKFRYKTLKQAIKNCIANFEHDESKRFIKYFVQFFK